jgi:hypothetical protein
MVYKRLLGSLVAGLLCASALAAAEVQNGVTVKVDGLDVPGVIGYRIEFNRLPLPKTDSRRLDLAYSPNERRLVLTVTQKGLKGLQEWLNLATDGGTPTTRVVTVTARNETDEVLVSWEILGAVPTTLSQAAAGPVNEITATLEFLFDRMRLVEASGK